MLNQHKAWLAKGIEVEYCTIGNKGFGFVNRMGGKIVSQVVNYGDRPSLERLIGPVKMLIDGYREVRIDEVHIFSNRFVNTMKQEPMHAHHDPDPAGLADAGRAGRSTTRRSATATGTTSTSPTRRRCSTQLLVRYLETFVYQAAAENIASEQSARMVAMKAASDNAQTIIDELQLIYNKNRQAAITKELSEIVGGAAAV